MTHFSVKSDTFEGETKALLVLTPGLTYLRAGEVRFETQALLP